MCPSLAYINGQRHLAAGDRQPVTGHSGKPRIAANQAHTHLPYILYRMPKEAAGLTGLLAGVGRFVARIVARGAGGRHLFALQASRL